MGKHGPRKKLSALERLEGNPSKRAIKESGIEGIGEPFISDHLVMDAKSAVMVVQASMPPGVYRKMDSFLLAAYGMAWALHKRAAEEISRPDFASVIVNGQGTPIASPWLKILDNQAQLLASLGGRLGLDPTSRQALQLPEQRKESRFYGLIGPLIEPPGSSNSSKS
jgi:Phage terminase, small subunit